MSPLEHLEQTLREHAPLVIAVSGGIDSMLLAHLAATVLGEHVRMAHALSPAVPAEATARVYRHARHYGWQLDVLDAGEFGDPRYRSNPVDRCYYCKLNLYRTIAGLASGVIASGTNRDDLTDDRPGLIAADEHRVVHPYVRAGIGKRTIYALARQRALNDLAELPAQPCLASRVETGIAIDAADLAFVERVEASLHERFGPSAVLRCRIVHGGVVLELGEPLLDSVSDAQAAAALVAERCAVDGRPFLGHRPYRRGAAFLREPRA